MMQFVLSLGFAVTVRSQYATCVEHGSRPGGKGRALIHRPTQHREMDIEGCYATCVSETKPLCKAWEWTSGPTLEKEGICKLYFHAANAGKPAKVALNVVSGARTCHPLKGRLLQQARRLEEAAAGNQKTQSKDSDFFDPTDYSWISRPAGKPGSEKPEEEPAEPAKVSTTVPASLPKSQETTSSPAFASMLGSSFGDDLPEGPLIGITAYKAKNYGAMAYHLAVFWMDDPTQLAPGPSSYALSNKYWTCADVGENALQDAADGSSVLNVERPVNFEVSFTLGPDGGSDNLRHPALNTVLIGHHPSAVFDMTPTYMGYVKVPEGLTLAKFLAVAREQGSAAIEMGGYNLTHGKDCQTFTVMMLMKLGLSGLTNTVVGSCINKAGLPWRSKIEPDVPDDVKMCSVIGSSGNFAHFVPVFPGYNRNTCNSSCDEAIYAGVKISGGEQYVDITWCLPNVSKCSNTNCGHPGQPSCIVDGKVTCYEGWSAYGHCVTSSEAPKSIMPSGSGDAFVSGGPEQCPGVMQDEAQN